jgi:hypothetical protein
MSDDSGELKIVVVPRELFYHEVAYVRGLEAEIERLQRLVDQQSKDLAASGIRELKVLEEIERLRALISECPVCSDLDKFGRRGGRGQA